MSASGTSGRATVPEELGHTNGHEHMGKEGHTNEQAVSRSSDERVASVDCSWRYTSKDM